ncbi:YjbF family lipoprotein, partial [Falsiroseomonas oryzae]|uniref:YjbF family lipoprotein n=1 Tax=Falsiroseomonas oryzae TaxID=2766473 RepID=UPI0022EB7938
PAEAASAAEGPALLMLTPRRVVLEPVSGAGTRRVWRGDGNLALATEGARVVGTAGFAQMVMATRFDGPDPLEDPRALLGREASARRTVDLSGADRDPATMRFGVLLDCTLRGREEGGWILVEERCTGGGLSFANRFWAEPERGAVLRSEQWAGEGVGVMTLELRGE